MQTVDLNDALKRRNLAPLKRPPAEGRFVSLDLLGGAAGRGGGRLFRRSSITMFANLFDGRGPEYVHDPSHPAAGSSQAIDHARIEATLADERARGAAAAEANRAWDGAEAIAGSDPLQAALDAAGARGFLSSAALPVCDPHGRVVGIAGWSSGSSAPIFGPMGLDARGCWTDFGRVVAGPLTVVGAGLHDVAAVAFATRWSLGRVTFLAENIVIASEHLRNHGRRSHVLRPGVILGAGRCLGARAPNGQSWADFAVAEGYAVVRRQVLRMCQMPEPTHA